MSRCLPTSIRSCGYEANNIFLLFFLGSFLQHLSFLSLRCWVNPCTFSRKYLDYEEEYVMAQSKVGSLSLDNESLKDHVSALSNEAKKDKDHLKTLEKSIVIEKAFEGREGWLRGSGEVQNL